MTIEHVRVMLELDAGSQPIVGRVIDESGSEVRFVGLVELVSILERLRVGDLISRPGEEKARWFPAADTTTSNS
ncbi:MAG TPA: hypothetical protein VFB39_06075 [Solirubrobacteraceae bacterium]|nr:hypothetical protein [Solirubrobacteraceae bacterium]